MLKTTLSLLSVSLLCVSCSDAAIEPSQSLVGAKELPTAKELSRETLYFSRGMGGQVGVGDLAYEWRPNDTLTVTHSVWNEKTLRQEAKSKEVLRLSPEGAAQARRLLWRVRPTELEGVEHVTLPLGCERQGPHDFGELTVAFISEGPKAGIDDDQVWLFDLPYTESCNTLAAAEARKLIRRVMQLLPRSKVAENFDRLQAAEEGGGST